MLSLLLPDGTGLDAASVRDMGLPSSASELLASWSPPKVGESFCQNPTETREGARPNPFSVDGSMNSPFPGFLIISLFLCNPASKGEEWADTEVLAISESLGKFSVSFRGCRLTVKDGSIPGTSVGSMVVTCLLALRLAKALGRTVELFSSSVLPKAEEGSEGGEEA